MALERETIEKKDFPVGRRGYEPSSVDAHLQAIADEVDQLKRSNRQRTQTLAATASDQVKAIIDAAETSGAEIRRQAEEEAREIRAEANRVSKRAREGAARTAQTERQQAATEAQRQRDEASSQARDYVRRVSDSTSQMLERLEAVEAEVGTLTESLRTGAGRLTAEIELVESQMRDLSSFASAGGADAATAEGEQPAVPASQPELSIDEKVEEEAVVVAAEPVAQAEPVAHAEPVAQAEPVAHAEAKAEAAATAAPIAEEEAPAEAANGEDTEGARLIALNMALNGTPREETDRYLAENFEISNRRQLLDEVYASVQR